MGLGGSPRLYNKCVGNSVGTKDGATALPHSVQLFDSPDSAAAALAAFVKDGLVAGERILLVTRLENWNRAAVELARDQVPLSDAIQSGRLTVCDSAHTLEALLDDGMPSSERFDRAVGSLVARLADGAPLRAYGDMVDLLAAEGGFAAAARLEQLWNDLRQRIPFTLFCGYSSAHFADADTSDSLRRIRHLHSHEACAPDDFMANQLMETAGRI